MKHSEKDHLVKPKIRVKFTRINVITVIFRLYLKAIIKPMIKSKYYRYYVQSCIFDSNLGLFQDDLFRSLFCSLFFEIVGGQRFLLKNVEHVAMNKVGKSFLLTKFHLSEKLPSNNRAMNNVGESKLFLLKSLPFSLQSMTSQLISVSTRILYCHIYT